MQQQNTALESSQGAAKGNGQARRERGTAHGLASRTLVTIHAKNSNLLYAESSLGCSRSVPAPRALDLRV